MEEIRTYILSVTAAALLCAIAGAVLGNKGTIAGILKLISGVVMACVVIQPLGEKITLNMKDYIHMLEVQASYAAQTGLDASKEELEERITQQTRTYILDKAAELDVELCVEVLLDDSNIPVPVGVILYGDASPYAKNTLQDMIRDELGIPMEAQVWN